jgi:hypothetical protein
VSTLLRLNVRDFDWVLANRYDMTVYDEALDDYEGDSDEFM